MDWTENYRFGYLNCNLSEFASIKEYHQNKDGFLICYSEKESVKKDTVFYVEFKGSCIGTFSTVEDAKSVVNKKIKDLIKELEDFVNK
jgi:hypothetical protein